MSAHRRWALATYTGFAAFGTVWGVWGASVPRVQQQAAVSDGKLGLALLFIGAGALPAMLIVGRVIDRWGLKPIAGLLAALGLAAVGTALSATGLPTLCLGLVVLGALSGSTDVGINAIAGRAEALSGRRVIARAHGVFSTAVVVSSLGTGAAFSAGASLTAPFAAVALIGLLAGGSVLVILAGVPAAAAARPGRAGHTAPGVRRPLLVPLALLGVLGALAFASENAQQSWSAVFAHNELQVSNGLAATAPAVFAATVAATRFTFSALRNTHDGITLRAGGVTAGGGAVIIAAAPNIAVAAVGLVLAAAGTAVLFPILISLVSRTVDEAQRGRATALVTSVSYLGFVLGPAYVGAVAGAGGLRVAMLAAGLLALILVTLTAPTLRVLSLSADRRVRPRSGGRKAAPLWGRRTAHFRLHASPADDRLSPVGDPATSCPWRADRTARHAASRTDC